jgi:hypothetical protein
MQKAFLAHGQEYVDKLVDETLEQAPEGPTIQEAFPAEGFDCTPPEELPTPTPEQLDKAFEQPAADSKELEIQCGPLNNASRTFREKYC